MAFNETPYVLDAAKQLESAARNLRKAADKYAHTFNRLNDLRQANIKISAAQARIDRAFGQLQEDK